MGGGNVLVSGGAGDAMFFEPSFESAAAVDELAGFGVALFLF